MIALQDYNPAEKSGNYLVLQKGDLVVLQQESTESYATGWCFGENERTGKKGDFPAECVYLLPTMTKPPIEILVKKNFILFSSDYFANLKLFVAATVFATINGKSE